MPYLPNPTSYYSTVVVLQTSLAFHGSFCWEAFLSPIQPPISSSVRIHLCPSELSSNDIAHINFLKLVTIIGTVLYNLISYCLGLLTDSSLQLLSPRGL